MAALAAGCLVTGSAVAQTNVQSRLSTPFIIHAVPMPEGEQTAAKGKPLLVHPVTTLRAARLTEQTAAESAGWFKEKFFPAGTLMFGAYAENKWSYCAVAESRSRFWSSDQFICYLDEDKDGRFEAAMDSGMPFQGVGILVFSQAAPKPLATPAPYERVALEDGPKVEFGIGFQIQRPRRRSDAPVPAATAIRPVVGFVGENGSVLSAFRGGVAPVPLVEGQRATIRIEGAEIEILGVNDDDSVRYRVVKTLPSRLDRIMMQIVTTTTWTVVSY